MTVNFLVRMLKPEIEVIIKDKATDKTLYKGLAGETNLNDKVITWDFTKDHIIYI